MKIKVTFFLLLATIYSIPVQGQNDKKTFVKSFIVDMLEMESLNKYIYNSRDYIIDFYLTEEYIINDVDGDTISVDINTGGAEFWTRLYFRFVRDENNRLFFKGIFDESTNIMTPWYDKIKICPPAVP